MPSLQRLLCKLRSMNTSTADHGNPQHGLRHAGKMQSRRIRTPFRSYGVRDATAPGDAQKRSAFILQSYGDRQTIGQT